MQVFDPDSYLRLHTGPTVRRFSKNTLVTSLRQTQKAVATAVAANRSPADQWASNCT
jgi:hypothetical protein